MKKFLPLLLTFCMCFVLAACGNSENIETAGTIGRSFPEEESTVATEDIDTADRKILVAYFSRTGENYSVGYIEKGNTHIIADMIAEQVGAEIFEISTVVPYPDDYDEMIFQKRLSFPSVLMKVAEFLPQKAVLQKFARMQKF